MKKIKLKNKTKRTLKNVLTWGLAIISCVGVLMLGSHLIKEHNRTTQDINPKWSIGALSTQGQYLESTESIYTNDTIGTKGLNIEIAFNKTISYEVYLYNAEGLFVEKTGTLTTNFIYDNDGETPYARIMITPNDDEEVKWYEVNKYANQLSIENDKDQEFTTLADILKNETNVAVGFGAGSFSNGEILSHESPMYYFSPIDVSDKTTAYIKVKTSVLNESIEHTDTNTIWPSVYYYLDGDGCGRDVVHDVVFEENNYSFIKVDVSSASEMIVFTSETGYTDLEIFVI